MSCGYACNCHEKKRALEQRNWGVSDYKCNHSAFAGYQCTASDYSQVHCLSCGRTWRSKGKYVDQLPLIRLDPNGQWEISKVQLPRK